MFKSTVAAVAAVLVLSPAAFADGLTKVTLKHEYDTALVTTDAGTAILLTELSRAAKRACSSRIPASGITYTDAECADTLFVAAVKKIHADQIESGASIAPAFEKAALTQLASAD